MGLGKVAPAPVIAAPVPDAAPVPLLEPPAPGAGVRSPDEQASASTAIAVDQGDMARNIVPPGWGPAPKVAADTRTRQHRGGSSRAQRPEGQAEPPRRPFVAVRPAPPVVVLETLRAIRWRSPSRST